MNLFWWAAGAIVVLVIGIPILMAVRTARAREEAEGWLKASGVSEHITGLSSGDAIGINYATKTLGVVAGGNRYLIEMHGIVSVELIEDSDTVSRVNRSGQIAGAAVGALALGGVGALIGGLSAGRTSKTKVSKLALRIFTDSPQVPVIEACAYQGLEVDRAGIVYRQAEAELLPWFGRLRAIVERGVAA